jgi:hypothetical protein
MAVPQRVVFNRKPKSTDKTREFMGFWRGLSRGRIREDRGAYAILFVILTLAMLIMIAIVVDLSAQKAYARDNRTVADFAALAAGEKLPGDPAAACNLAWLYLKANLPSLPAGATSPCTSGVPALFSSNLPCTPSTPATIYQATGTGSYQISFTYPVPLGDPTLGSQATNATFDGTDADRCGRLAVTVRSNFPSLFGGIIGARTLSAPATAVVRGAATQKNEAPVALLLLDTNGCSSSGQGPLLVSGQGGVSVYSPGVDTPGYISVDSDGTKSGNPSKCQGGNYTLEVSGNTQGFVQTCGNSFDSSNPTKCDPGGVINLFAMGAGQSDCTSNTACDPTDRTTFQSSSSGVSPGLPRLYPAPQQEVSRATRGVVDRHFNCNQNYPNYPIPALTSQGYESIGITGCTFATSSPSLPPYIDQLRSFAKTNGSSNLPGFSDYNAAGGSCSPGNGSWPVGNWVIHCSGANGFLVNGSTFEFKGGNLVFDGDINIRSSGTLKINTSNTTNPPLANPGCRRPQPLCPTASSPDASWVFIRNSGSLKRDSQSNMNFNHVMVYVNNGNINLGGGGGGDNGTGTGSLSWSAPDQGLPDNDNDEIFEPETPQDADDATLESPFDRLALWSEGTSVHGIGGQGSLNLSGVFFIPNAVFNYSGQATQFMDKAQFIVFEMTVTGKGYLLMQPNPQFVLPIPIQSWNLIR